VLCFFFLRPVGLGALPAKGGIQVRLRPAFKPFLLSCNRRLRPPCQGFVFGRHALLVSEAHFSPLFAISMMVFRRRSLAGGYRALPLSPALSWPSRRSLGPARHCPRRRWRSSPLECDSSCTAISENLFFWLQAWRLFLPAARGLLSLPPTVCNSEASSTANQSTGLQPSALRPTSRLSGLPTLGTHEFTWFESTWPIKHQVLLERID